MNRFVPYLADEAIERDAASLIGEYERARGVTIEPPIPVEDIVEKHLKLRIEFDDMHARHNVPRPPNGQPDILGAIYGDGSIFIDESLDPEENPTREGRYRFTLAHEGGGHWRLHQHLIVQDTAQTSFLDAASEPKFICRSSAAKERVEWQADFYASCLHMFLWINSPHFNDQIDPGRSNGVPHISSKQVEAAEIPLPPLAEQHRIVARIDALMALCDRLEAALATADTTRARLLEALLHEALDPATTLATEAAE